MNNSTYINLPCDTIEKHLPICPQCKDTKFIKADNSIKLGGLPTQTLTCKKCNISWDMYYEII